MLLFGIGCLFVELVYLLGSQLIIVASTVVLCCSYYFVWKAYQQSGIRLVQVGNASNQAEERRRRQQERKLANKVLTLIGFYMVAFIPTILFTALLIVQLSRPDLVSEEGLKYGNLITTYLGLSNSCCNPFIYVWKDAAFRTACKRLFRKRAVVHPPRNNITCQTSKL